ncbi:PREDICTED: flap endonuclease 1-like [Nanorana parkeri]|uniref:flap endonuclease 1-like n=1 Tax=Nanorana parkeri TaxID=125878 RepID=UPI000854DA2C|nr:PREDICTED: flap endonuclease 1-like [Nanorana parkeri]
MGITHLADVLRSETPGAIQTRPPDHYRGKILAVDASVFIWQFQSAIPTLNNRTGEDISVLQGLFNRTIYMLEKGMKPVYVFDGVPPERKRAKVSQDGSCQVRRPFRAVESPGPERQGDLKKLLRLMGVPVVQAPSEAEATCAALVKSDKAWGAVTEDMDALPFGCTRLIRNLKADKKKEIEEYNLPEILSTLKMSREQFVDLCILLGCDYTSKIKGLGEKKALKMIQKYGTIENILQTIRSEDRIPSDFCYKEARRLFLEPEVADVTALDLEWKKVEEGQVLQFLSGEKFMNKERVQQALQKLHPVKTSRKRKAKSGASGSSAENQKKINDFFTVKKSATQSKTSMGSTPTSSR